VDRSSHLMLGDCILFKAQFQAQCTCTLQVELEDKGGQVPLLIPSVP